MKLNSEKIILALDFSTAQEALQWVDRCLPVVKTFKVGKQLFTRVGPDIIRQIHERGGRVFLDLKFHDIPNTVARACEAAAAHQVFMTNVHVMGGLEMMRAARETLNHPEERQSSSHPEERRRRDEGSPPNHPLLIGVTLLTSLSGDDLKDLGIEKDSKSLVIHYAKLAKRAGLDGVVCAVEDVPNIKKACGASFITVTPGVRLGHSEGSPPDDQKRIATLDQALESGTDFIVLGRSLFNSADPASLLKEILARRAPQY